MFIKILFFFQILTSAQKINTLVTKMLNASTHHQATGAIVDKDSDHLRMEGAVKVPLKLWKDHLVVVVVVPCSVLLQLCRSSVAILLLFLRLLNHH